MKVATALLVALVAVGYAETLSEEAEMEKCGGNPCAASMCAQHKYCDTCSKDMRCGWCDSEGDNGACLPGVANGPHKKNCTTWDYAVCSNLPCSAHTTCDACATNDLCGWCSTSNVCTEGSARGPVFMTCMRKDWLPDTESCNRLYVAPCDCPEADGVTCKSADNCEKNNLIKQGVVSDEDPPEDLGKVEWYDSVKPQIHVDLVPVKVMEEPPKPAPEPKEEKRYPFPASDVHPDELEKDQDDQDDQGEDALS